MPACLPSSVCSLSLVADLFFLFPEAKPLSRSNQAWSRRESSLSPFHRSSLRTSPDTKKKGSSHSATPPYLPRPPRPRSLTHLLFRFAVRVHRPLPPRSRRPSRSSHRRVRVRVRVGFRPGPPGFLGPEFRSHGLCFCCLAGVRGGQVRRVVVYRGQHFVCVRAQRKRALTPDPDRQGGGGDGDIISFSSAYTRGSGDTSRP